MRFFEQQDAARGQTRRLLLGFALAVLATVAGVHVALVLLWLGLRALVGGWLPFPAFFLSVNVGVTLLLVLGGWWIETSNLRMAGAAARLAQRIGGAGARLDDSAIRVPDRRLGADGASQGRLGPFLWWALPRATGERTLVLRLREQPIVIAQGLVWPGAVPNLRDTDSQTLLDSLRVLRGIARGAITVLGEQGPTGTTDDIGSHMDYLVSLRAAVSAHVRDGTDANAAMASISLPMFAARVGHGEIDALNRQRVWREMEDASFRR